MDKREILDKLELLILEILDKLELRTQEMQAAEEVVEDLVVAPSLVCLANLLL